VIAERPEFQATSQDTVVVIHDHGDFHFAFIMSRLGIPDGPGITEITERIHVVPDADGVYRLQLSIPEPELKGPWLVTVLLPPDTHYVGDEDVEQQSRLDDGRNILSWAGEQDPVLDVLWSFIGR
jgi:hypothetical protein